MKSSPASGAGARRSCAGLSDVPVVMHEADDKEALELAIIENVQRADLNAIEEAKGYERLGAEFGYSHGDIAKIIGKSRSHVANTIRLLNLPEDARQLVGEGAISAGHARALLAVARPQRGGAPHRRKGNDGSRRRATGEGPRLECSPVEERRHSPRQGRRYARDRKDLERCARDACRTSFRG